jgi:1-phosphofructokinase family hexose kinase
MLLSAGLTPSYQQIMIFDSLRHGAVNRAREVSWHVQGKVLNAGIAAHFLGGPSLTLSPIGGSPMQDIERQFTELGVPHRWTKTQAGTRVCTTLIDRATDTNTELIENGRPMSPAELAEYHRAYVEEAAKAEVVILTGSLTDGASPLYYRALLDNTPCPAILDFRGEGLLATLDLNPYIVKPNREELAQTVGMNLENDDEVLPAMRSLNHRGAAWVIVTDGAKPVWVSSTTRFYRFHPIDDIKVVNPIGSGDAMAAGLAWATRAGWDIVRAVQFGIAAATDNMSQLETCRLDFDRVRRLSENVRVEKLE